METAVLIQIGFLIVIVQKLIEALVQPAFLKLKIDTWWLLYVSLLFGGIVGFLTGLNAFPIFPAPIVGRIFTALICGAGPTFLYDMIDRGSPARLPTKPIT